MKKTVSLMLALMFILSILSGCSSGPDLTEVTEKYNEVSDLFNETAVLVDQNGWTADEDILETHNSIADTLNEIAAMLEDPEQSKNIDVDTLTANLDALIPLINDYKTAISMPYVIPFDLSALTDKYNEAMILYTQVEADAQANGWLDNETLVASLNDIADILEVSRNIIEDPAVLEDGNITQADLDEYTSDIDQFIPILTDLQEVVAVPAE